MKTMLDLYRESLRDLHDVDITRYLFDATGCAIFIWVNDNGELHSFQAEWRDMIYLYFKRPSTVTIKRRTDDPIDGAVSEDVPQEDRERIRDLVKTFDHAEFPVLFGIVRDIASGTAVAELRLPETELKRLRKVHLSDLNLLANKKIRR